MPMKDSVVFSNGQVVLDNQLILADLVLAQGKIQTILAPGAASGDNVVDMSGRLILPGFIDCHTHGGIGIDVNHATKSDLLKLSTYFASCGTTCYLPTVLTDTCDKTTECLLEITAAMQSQSVDVQGSHILGAHLEGPYLCPEYRGSMPLSLLRNPSWEEFCIWQAAANGSIRLMTIAPELDGAIEFIARITEKGVIASLGHSGATYEAAIACIKAGASSTTHTFNGMKLLHQHDPGVLGAALESDIYCEMICDGRHLHPGTIRLLLKTKGPERVIAVTDSIMAAGLGDGAYKLGVNDVVVIDGDARLADGSSRAGSTLTMIKAFHNILNFTGKSIPEVSSLMSANPARMLGIDSFKGQIKPGFDADLVVLDSEMTLQETWVAGSCCFSLR